jgi:hypothetical protein
MCLAHRVSGVEYQFFDGGDGGAEGGRASTLVMRVMRYSKGSMASRVWWPKKTLMVGMCSSSSCFRSVQSSCRYTATRARGHQVSQSQPPNIRSGDDW